jgi:hypothetical protein
MFLSGKSFFSATLVKDLLLSMVAAIEEIHGRMGDAAAMLAALRSGFSVRR